MYDVAVVGASIAGSVLSREIAKHGYTVALIDKQAFPRSKPCGEGLSKIGLEALTKLGYDELSTLPLRPFSGYAIHPLKGQSFHIPTEIAGIAVERTLLDSCLFNAAAREGYVNPIIGQSVHHLEPESGTVHLEDRSIRARFIVDAAGQRGWLYNDVPRGNPRPDRYGLTFHLEGKEEFGNSYANVFLRPEGEYFCTPLSGRRINLSFLGHREQHRSHLITHITEKAIPDILEKLQWNGQIEGRFQATPIYNARFEPIVGERCVRIGDACEQFDPIAGMGMTHAILSATLAARSICHALQHPAALSSALKQYELGRERAARPLRGFTTLTSHSLRSWQDLPILRTLTRSSIGRSIGSCLYRTSTGASLERVALALLGAYV